MRIWGNRRGRLSISGAPGWWKSMRYAWTVLGFGVFQWLCRKIASSFHDTCWGTYCSRVANSELSALWSCLSLIFSLLWTWSQSARIPHPPATQGRFTQRRLPWIFESSARSERPSVNWPTFNLVLISIKYNSHYPPNKFIFPSFYPTAHQSPQRVCVEGGNFYYKFNKYSGFVIIYNKNYYIEWRTEAPLWIAYTTTVIINSFRWRVGKKTPTA